MGCGTFHARSDWRYLEIRMPLFSRAFIRKRMISLAATASVTATSFALAQDRTMTRHVPAEEQPFLSENAAAMNKMMADMAIKPTGDADRDFVAMMVPHHQGAVDMAKAELKYGHNEQLRRLAGEIVAMQQQQITVMRDAVADGKSPQSPPNEGSVGVGRGGMSMPR
jgi:uncharacterized protein (DUF305 family)